MEEKDIKKEQEVKEETVSKDESSVTETPTEQKKEEPKTKEAPKAEVKPAARNTSSGQGGSSKGESSTKDKKDNNNKRKPRRRLSIYGQQLLEKQGLKEVYGLREGPFRRIYGEANRLKGSTGDNLMELLERRLDNVVFRAGFATTRSQARQMVSHRHIKVNGHKAKTASIITAPDDKIEVSVKLANSTLYKNNFVVAKKHKAPAWLRVDAAALKAEITRLPKRDEIDTPVNEQLIIEFYSR